MGIKRRGIKSAATDALSQIIDFGSSTWRTLVKFVGDDKDKAIIISTTENSTRPSKNLGILFSSLEEWRVTFTKIDIFS
ncbi:hypothetical protein Ahy_A05g021827 isoform B [Arachis hypogaea]|uniref:Uncharacterized protein n=1 Tax=Arachis hypogaea TaxID=3818 RepID=A0A445CYN0_ARAHY|nr:hypothetical protein Ahy_A05g021827 isoform B [Arachis hypogaea]